MTDYDAAASFILKPDVTLPAGSNMAHYRSRGLEVIPADNTTQMSSPPFAAVQCPLCNGTSFTSFEYSLVWCNTCGVQFAIRPVASSPGWRVELRLGHYSLNASPYLIPRSDEITLNLVFLGYDLRDMKHYAQEGALPQMMKCSPENLKLTDGKTGLRAGLHACKILNLDDWHFGGHVPSYVTRHRTTFRVSDGSIWPDSAILPITGFSWQEAQQIRPLLEELKNGEKTAGLAASHTEALDILFERLELPNRRPEIQRGSLPDPSTLKEGEKFLLHHWLVSPKRGDSDIRAYPIWYVVRQTTQQKKSKIWEILRQDICPGCSKQVQLKDLEEHAMREVLGLRTEAHLAHSSCPLVWRYGWPPYQAALAEARQRRLPEQP